MHLQYIYFFPNSFHSEDLGAVATQQQCVELAPDLDL